ncbi:MAG: Cyclic pyranopterin monophosphate synthase accessory protein, partial [uncultured Thermomicrobiales bacterium]
RSRSTICARRWTGACASPMFASPRSAADAAARSCWS